MNEDAKVDEGNPNDPRTRIRKQNRIITSWQKHCDRMAKILGCFGMQDAVEEAATELKAENARLQSALKEQEDRRKQMSEVTNDSPVKVPVRYDPKQQIIRGGEFGEVYVAMPKTFDSTEERDAKMNQRGQYIANCINSHACLLADNKALSEKVEKVGMAFQNAVDVHNQMSEPRGVSGTTVHACDMCEALNELYNALVLPDEKGETR